MKRHPALREFSDDHHQGLVHALRLRRAASDSSGRPEEVGRAFLQFWREDTSVHFRKEEEVLLAVVALHAGQMLDDESVTQMLAQHARIRGLAMRLDDELNRREAEPEILGELGELLEAHIRLEERVVFPLIEEALPEDALTKVSEQLEVFEAGRSP
ncbi:MAG: hemerythrin domain-containing protein [Rubrobacter sp.]|nr:hemerythrin domain-containing protein [Rubrobacter sp.]